MLKKSHAALALTLLAASLPIASAEEKAPAPAPAPATAPAKARPDITDPKLKQLVEEARKARIGTDHAAALVKLDEAKGLAPKDPNVLYERALLFEDMAKFDQRLKETAAESYQALFELGAEKAGSLYDLAAKKLADGI